MSLKSLARLSILLTSLTLLPTVASAKPAVEVTFVIDTTGSMSGLIEAAKRKVWSIATAIADHNADLRMGLVAYRDIGDAYVTRTHELTTDIQGMYAHLLAFRAEGGGDWPESVNEALDVAVTKMNWSQEPGVQRVIFLVGDAPPHMDYAQDRKYPDVLKDAVARGIVVNALQAGGAEDTTRVWRSIAQLGNGTFLQIPQDGGRVSVIITPFDDRIFELQRMVNKTIVPYGSMERQGSLRGIMSSHADNVAVLPDAVSTAADASSYLAKKAGKGAAITGDGDLVDDVISGRVPAAKVPAADLPPDIAALPPAELQLKLQGLADKRRSLASEMAGLVKQRDAFIAQQQSTTLAAGAPTDSFDRAVFNMLGF
jgi:von Willebrand factor type A domain